MNFEAELSQRLTSGDDELKESQLCLLPTCNYKLDVRARLGHDKT